MANQSQELSANEESMILPDDFTMPESSADIDFAAAQEGPGPSGNFDNTDFEADPEVKAELPKFKVKYNHEEKELGYDDAVPLIQKGMNYDKLSEKFNSIQNDPRLGKYDKVQEVSKLLGYQTDDELIDALFNTYYESTASQQGLTAEQIRMDTELSRRESALSQKEQEKGRQEARNMMFGRLLETFPDIKASDIKPQTWGLVRSGVDLTAAYVEQRNRELETQLKTLKQNAKNARSAPVGSTTEHGVAEAGDEDPFLRGFNSI